jgi:hypothetical protein
VLTADILLEHRKAGCFGAWRLESRAGGYHWRCPSCLRLYPASAQDGGGRVWETRVTELTEMLSRRGVMPRQQGA